MSTYSRMMFSLIVAVVLAVFPAMIEAGGGSSSAPTIAIPALGVTSRIVEFPLGNSSWVIDPWERRVGHLEGTPGLNQGGNVVLAAHSRMPNLRRGVFSRLHQLQTGDTIVVFDGTQEYRYQVSAVLNVDYTDISVAYPTSHDQLTLITCDTSTYNASRGDYDKRIVVIATRAG